MNFLSWDVMILEMIGFLMWKVALFSCLVSLGAQSMERRKSQLNLLTSTKRSTNLVDFQRDRNYVGKIVHGDFNFTTGKDVVY